MTLTPASRRPAEVSFSACTGTGCTRAARRMTRGIRTMAETFRFVNEDTVFTLPWEVAIQEGLFQRAGLEVEIADKNPGNTAPDLFGRNKEVLFESGGVDAFNVCEWGAIKRTAVEGRTRQGRILGFRESITAMGIVTRKDSGIVRAEELASVPVAGQDPTG